MSDYDIEKGIPIPRARDPYNSYPFGEMEVGDSFFVRVGRDDNPRTVYERVRTAASHHAKMNKKRFSVRNAKNSKAEGVRCWRIE